MFENGTKSMSGSKIENIAILKIIINSYIEYNIYWFFYSDSGSPTALETAFMLGSGSRSHSPADSETSTSSFGEYMVSLN